MDSLQGSPENQDTIPFVVGIGASAGGLEALEEFFRNVKEDSGLSYVVVQHLSPDFESLMDQLLARTTNLPIKLIENEQEILENTIYLLPPKKEVILSEGKLLLTDRPKGRELSYPIDNFFRSLAQDIGPAAIAVVLSGTGSDGSRGIVDVHESGGFVLVQSEASARFDGMPRSACDTGIVDAILSASEMAEAIERYTQSSIGLGRRADLLDPQRTKGPTFAILNLLKKSYEIDFSHYKTNTISRRIERRVLLSGSENVSTYAKRLRTDDKELDSLYKDLLIGVTGFFRDSEVFQSLESEVIPKLIENIDSEQEIRVWVVATATGEEAYSIAILLNEAYEKSGKVPRVKIFASDVHHESLEHASRGIYQEESLGGLTPERRERYFEERLDGFHASPELRKMVVFVPHNVIFNAPFTNLDLITCRNLFIYLTPSTQKKVLSLFHFGLKTGGCLCLGSSETPGELSHEFEAIDEKSRIYRKHRDVNLPASMRMPFSSSPLSLPPISTTATETQPAGMRKLMGTYDVLLDKYLPPSLLLSQEHELLHTFGDASSYMRVPRGRPPRNALDLLNPALKSAASAAVRRSKQEGSAACYAKLPMANSDTEQHLRISAEVFTEQDNQILVCFSLEDEVTIANRPAVEIGHADITSEEYDALERELARTQANLQSTVEEAQTTNEELQAANEQLTASNEELQSTNEELHSVNEELYTVNAEHQRKIDELIELTDDMDNLLNSTNIHTIFLDRQLRIRRFTPGIRETFNLLSQDVGRPFGSFTHNINHDNLARLAESVIDSKSSVEQEVQDKNDHWYLLRILPYQTRGQVDGAVLTLIDITSLKQAESKLAELSEIVEHSDDAIFRQDIDGTIRTWNRGAERLFAIKAPKVLGGHVEMLGLDCRDIAFNKILKLTASGESLDHIEARHKRQDGDFVDIAISVSPIRDVNGNVIGASTIARDVTRQKQAEAEVREAVKRRDDFLAMLSHELRNPLAAVLNATNLMTEIGLQEKPIEEAKDVIEHNVRHVARILDDLLDVSRIANDKINLHKEVVDLCSLTIDVVECVQHRIDDKGQELHVHQPPEPLYVEGDVGRLQQMQVNLLVNASKYTAEGGRIEYEVYQDGDEAIISVTDNGVGIPESLLNTIFEPFVQAEQTIDRAQGGMGLGLTLVSKVAEAHGGSVSANSDGNGMGSCFSIILPITRKRPKSQVQTELTEIDGLKLVIVEDNDGVRNMLARTLELKGFVVATAATGREGIELIQQMHPTVAVIDIGLPDLNGYEVANEIRDDPELQNVLKVALTGYGRDRDQQKAMQAGFDIHLVKPLDPDELLRAVAEKYVAITS